MHAIWNGAISFGLVNIPINLYSAADENRLNLRMLHKTDQMPIRYLKVCQADGQEVSYDDIVKGFEYQKNEFVVLEDKDFEKANIKSTHLIDIVEFVNETEIDIRFYEKPYYLEPGKSADKAYSLLSEALRRSKKVAVAHFVLHNREHLAIIKSINNVLVLTIIRYVTEVRDLTEVKIPKHQALKREEIDTALALIKQLTHRFKPQQFHDTYMEELKAVIKAKAAGQQPKSKGKKPTTTKAKNLMYVLKQSLKKAREKKSAVKVKSRRKAA